MEFSKSFASHPKSSHWSSKNKVKPNEVPLYYYKKYWFDCDKCDHEFETNLNSIARIGSWCPYCANKSLCLKDSCQICFDKSFASSEKSKHWSDKNENKPRNVFKSCNEKFLFNCDGCEKELSITLNNVTNGKWCYDCGRKSSKEKQSMKIEEFKKRSQEKHGDKYDYSKVVMNGVDRKIIIICKTHGEFLQSPYNHCKGQNCPSCATFNKAENRKFTLSEFINKAKETHGDKYDYSKVIYKNSQEYVTIICKLHGEFSQVANSHLGGCGCKKCGEISSHDKQRLSINEFIERSKIVHGDKYDYSKTVYTKGHGLITIICKIHGEFEQDPNNHMKGFGCKRCSRIFCLQDFIIEANEIHNNLYDYSLVEYTKSIVPVKIICKECGVFEQTPNAHLGGRGCPICVNKTEQKLYLWLKSKFDNILKEYNPDFVKNEISGRNLRFDFYLPDLKLIIELDGRQHFQQVIKWNSFPDEQLKNDVWKMKKANNNGICVIRLLQEEVFKNKISWLDENLLPKLIKRDTNSIVVSKEYIYLYEKHLELLNE